MEERRRRTRVEGQFTVTILAGDQEYSAQTLNLSLIGLGVRAFPGCADLVGRDCYLHLSLAKDAFIVLEARAVWADAERLGLEFLSMPDEESYGHLRNIVRYRAPDPDAIDREQLTPAFGQGDTG
jgi:hypothetical protein